MILYLDTSALVKLFVREAGSAQVRAWAQRATATATSVVAYAEGRAAFARLHGQAPASPKRHRERVTRLNASWDALVLVELIETVVRLAAETPETYEFEGLRQHSSRKRALAAPTDRRTCVFVVFDRRLWEGAARAGLSVLPARLPRAARAG